MALKCDAITKFNGHPNGGAFWLTVLIFFSSCHHKHPSWLLKTIFYFKVKIQQQQKKRVQIERRWTKNEWEKGKGTFTNVLSINFRQKNKQTKIKRETKAMIVCGYDHKISDSHIWCMFAFGSCLHARTNACMHAFHKYVFKCTLEIAHQFLLFRGFAWKCCTIQGWIQQQWNNADHSPLIWLLPSLANKICTHVCSHKSPTWNSTKVGSFFFKFKDSSWTYCIRA